MKNPEIRFIDDNIDWQNKKIEDILEPYAEKNINNYPSVAIGRYGIRKREEIYSKELTKDTTKNKVINKNTLTVGMGSTQIDIGILHTDEHFSVSPAYHTFNILDNDSKFIESSFAKNNEKYSKQHMIIGARQGKSVDFPNFLADTIYLPPMKVQQEIASLLTNIEDKITKQENLIQKLKDTKSSLLLKMFPQENQSVPELRFDGFTNDWEQRKFGDVFKEYSEKHHEELPPLMIIQGGGTIRRDESDRNISFDTANLYNYKVIHIDDFIVHLRSFEGGLEKSNHNGLISPAYHTFHGDNINSDFYYPYFRSKKFINIDLTPHVYGVRDGRSIDMNGLKTILIPYTFYTEQEKIGKLLLSIDNLITLHQRKPFHLNFSL